MRCLGIAEALYDYAAQADDELTIAEGDKLYLDELVDEAWYKARPRSGDRQGQGLVPANYVEICAPEQVVVALYDYEAQGDDELTFTEGQVLDVLERDGEWLLARKQSTPEVGLIPSNYVEMQGDGQADEGAAALTASSVDPNAGSTAAEPKPEPEPELEPEPERLPASTTTSSPSAAAAAATTTTTTTAAASAAPANATSESQPKRTRTVAPPPPFPTSAPSAPSAPAVTAASASAPAPAASVPLPSEIVPQVTGIDDEMDETDGQTSTVAPRAVPASWTSSDSSKDEIQMWSVTEVDPKKRKRKNKGTLGVGNACMFFATDADGAAVPRVDIRHVKSTTLEKNKYLLVTLDPAANIDGDTWAFHVGSRTAYQAISARIGESKSLAMSSSTASSARNQPSSSVSRMPTATTAGSVSSSAAVASPRPAQEMVVVLYDFDAQADDELSVSEHDQLVLVERENHEWWKLQNASGQVGVVPAAYVQLLQEHNTPDMRALNEKYSTMRDPRRSAPRLPVDRRDRAHDQRGMPDPRATQAPLQALPPAHSAGRMRTWVDATGKFRVDAELIGVRRESVRLLKGNGALIDVPLAKMSLPDLRFLEGITGRDLVSPPPARASGGHDPHDALRHERHVHHRAHEREREREREARRLLQHQYRPDIDWFEFFLEAGVDMNYCSRYADTFERDHMDRSVLTELEPDTLRRLGLREGDILRVRRHIHQKYANKTTSQSMSARSSSGAPVSEEDQARQAREDEALARRLQAQEIAAQRRAAPRQPRSKDTDSQQSPQPLPPRASEDKQSSDAATIASTKDTSAAPLQPAQTGVDPETIAAAVEIIRRREREEAEEREKAAKKDERPADPNSALFDQLERLKPNAKPTTASAPSPSTPDPNAPRAPFAPVPVNQSLLQPLIPLQGTGNYVPTGGFASQPTGMMAPQMTSPFSMSSQPAGMYGVPQPMLFGATGTAPIPSSMQPPQPTLGAATEDTTSPIKQQDRFSAANVFEQMKTGTGAFASDNKPPSAPQSSSRYDALRAQPTGFAPGGIVDPSPFGGGMMMSQGMPSNMMNMQPISSMPTGGGMMMGMTGPGPSQQQSAAFMPMHGFYPS